MSLTTKHVTDRIATALGFLADEGFRYYRTTQDFRRQDPEGYSYIVLNVVTGDRASYRLSFYMGVRIDALESVIKEILQQPAKLTHDDRSLINYTVNIGPGSHGWDYPVWGTWSFQDDSDIDAQLPGIISFLRDVMLPFLNGNTTSEAVRKTLLETPGRTINFHLFRQVLGNAVLTGDLALLESDHALICQQYPKWHAGLKADLADFHARAAAFLEARSPG